VEFQQQDLIWGQGYRKAFSLRAFLPLQTYAVARSTIEKRKQQP
jgi:hypothetical protein